MFGTSGIRGIYGKEVNEELALKIANIFAEKDVVVARDTRNTGEALVNAVIAGILSAGKNAIFIGIAPTPTLALSTKKYRCNGIMITASHNPPEYNGLKLFSEGVEISRKKEKEIKEKYKKNKLNYANWDSLGQLRKDGRALEEHKELIKNLVEKTAIKTKKPRVVVDANGAGTVITPPILRELGCEVITINDSLVGFSRGAEPNAENLKMLSEKVVEEGADLGIGHDGDGDRTIIVDERGNVLNFDVQLAIIVEHELEKNTSAKKKVVSTVEASLIVRETVENAGGELIITPVGSLYVSEALEREDAIFGGEPCGEYIFKNGVHVPDGILTAAKFVEVFCEKGMLGELSKKYKTYPVVRRKFLCENSKKAEVVRKIKKEIKLSGKLREEDGIRIDDEEGWFLIRASGTEPAIRLTAEYKNVEMLNKRVEELSAIIKKYI
jgi:phosphoglucosamine mutase